jgi:hypothetical protein
MLSGLLQSISGLLSFLMIHPHLVVWFLNDSTEEFETKSLLIVLPSLSRPSSLLVLDLLLFPKPLALKV